MHACSLGAVVRLLVAEESCNLVQNEPCWGAYRDALSKSTEEQTTGSKYCCDCCRSRGARPSSRDGPLSCYSSHQAGHIIICGGQQCNVISLPARKPSNAVQAVKQAMMQRGCACVPGSVPAECNMHSVDQKAVVQWQRAGGCQAVLHETRLLSSVVVSFCHIFVASSSPRL